MVEISKHLFDKCCKDLTCHILHPQDKRCLQAIPDTLYQSLKGSIRFYAIVYMIQLAMRGNKLSKKKEWIKMGQYYLRSVTLGAGICSSYVTLGCIFSGIFGSLPYYMCAQVANTLNGFFIFLEPPQRRGLVINLFFNLLLEYWIRTLEMKGVLSMTTSKQTLMFMCSNAVLFYLMRMEGDRKKRTPLLWLVTPEKVRQKKDDQHNACPHNGPCSNYILKGAGVYFSLGIGISLAKVLLPKITSPIRALSSLRGKHFNMALFFSSYIGIYRAVMCYLCRKNGFDSALYALPAGYLAGLSFIFSPKIGFATAAFGAVVKLFSTVLYDKKMLPANVPLPELFYCVAQGILFHARLMHPDVCPAYVKRLIDTVSCDRSLHIVNAVKDACAPKST